MKICTKCNIEKEFIEFSKDKYHKTGYKSICKICAKKYIEDNKEKIKKYFEDNKDKFKERKKQYYKENKDKIILKSIEYVKKNKEKTQNYMKQYHKKNYEKNKKNILNRVKLYKKNNKEKVNETNRKYAANRKKNDNIFKFSHNVRSLVKGSFKRGKNQFQKNAKTETILGCKIEEFRVYIQSKFTNGMTLENHGKWHLDHIIPLASANTEEDIIKLNHYTNFQPLWAFDNLSKGCKY
jgi:hypothetical protein